MVAVQQPRRIKGSERNKFLKIQPHLDLVHFVRCQINVNVNVISSDPDIWIRPSKISDARRTDVRWVGYYCG